MTRIVRRRGRDGSGVDLRPAGRESPWDRGANEQRENAGMRLELLQNRARSHPFVCASLSGCLLDPTLLWGVANSVQCVARSYALFDCDVLGTFRVATPSAARSW